jgi:hypothetical protein
MRIWIAPAPTFAGRGGEVREPDLGDAHSDLPAAAKGRASKNFRATIPVYVHVITDGAVGSLTDAQIAAQLTVLNRTFAGREGGANTGFSFELAGVTRTDNAEWFYAGPGTSTTYAGRSDQGETATHEVGHWLDPVHNYMDYSFDSCYTQFTAGQTQRMRDAWLLWRAP